MLNTRRKCAHVFRRNVQFVFLLLFILCVRPSLAQFETATLSGTVIDPQKAVVADAMATVRSDETSLERQAKTNAQGLFVFGSLPIGHYTLRIERTGFATFEMRNIVLTVAESLAVNAQMKLGDAAETVNVDGSGELALETDSSQRGQIVNREEIRALPLVSRQYSQLVLLTTGTMQSQAGISNGNLAREGAFNVDGLRSTFNNYLLDGLDNNAYGTSNQGFSNQIIQPSPDAVAQFQVVTNNESAEYGRAPGATVNVAFASGSNRFHFDLYEFIRNPAFNAIGYFSGGNPSIRRNQFGGTLSGPIIKNKLFFFADYEGFRQKFTTPHYSTIPTPDQIHGIFSTVITNPLTGKRYVNPDGSPAPIPAADMSAAARKISAFFPTPNVSLGGLNYLQLQQLNDNLDKYDLKLDYVPNDKTTLFARVSQSKENALQGPTLPGPLDGGVAGHIRIMNQQLALGVTRQITPTQLLDARLGVSYTKGGDASVVIGQPGAEEAFGIPGLTTDPRIAGGMPSIFINGYSQIGRLATDPQWQYPFVFDPKINYSWTKGKHFLKFGYEYEQIRTQVEDEFPLYGLYIFYGGFSGNYFADFLLGTPYQFELTNLTVSHIRQVMHNAYVQDDWKVNKRLTLNFGLRYEYGSPLWDKDNNLTNFDPVTSVTTGKMVNAQSGGVAQRALVNPDKNDFAPRIGFAFGATDSTVIHGGFGISYVHYYRAGSGNLLALNAPNTLFAQQTQLPGQANFRTLDQGFPQGFNDPANFNPITVNVSYIPKNFRDGYVESYFLSVQQKLGRDSMLDVAYVGNHGLKMMEIGNYNQRNPAAGIDATGQFARPIPSWGDITYAFNGSYSNYNALQVRYQQRLGRDLTLLNSFTYSRTFDNASGNHVLCSQDRRHASSCRSARR